MYHLGLVRYCEETRAVFDEASLHRTAHRHRSSPSSKASANAAAGSGAAPRGVAAAARNHAGRSCVCDRAVVSLVCEWRWQPRIFQLRPQYYRIGSFHHGGRRSIREHRVRLQSLRHCCDFASSLIVHSFSFFLFVMLLQTVSPNAFYLFFPCQTCLFQLSFGACPLPTHAPVTATFPVVGMRTERL